MGGWWRGRSNSSGGGGRYSRLKGCGRAPPPSASWAENTIMTECTQESGGLCALLSVVFAVCTEQGKGSGSTQAGITLNTDVTRGEGIPEYEAMCTYVNCGFAKKFAEGYKGLYYADSFAF
jgi:hypothetical protein